MGWGGTSELAEGFHDLGSQPDTFLCLYDCLVSFFIYQTNFECVVTSPRETKNEMELSSKMFTA